MGGTAVICSEPTTPFTVADTDRPFAIVAVVVVAPALLTSIQMSASPLPSVATMHVVVLQGSKETEVPGAENVTAAPGTGVPSEATTRTRKGLGAVAPTG